MKKILLNGLHYAPDGAGISKYTHKLLEAFVRGNYDIDILMRQEFQCDNQDERLIFVDKALGSSTKRILEEQIGQSRKYKTYDLIHFPDYATPIFYTGSKIATIHDMAMHTMRDKYTLMQNLTKNVLLQHTINKAEQLICVSEFSKQELLHYYPHVKDKATVVYEGIEIPKWEISKDRQKKVLDKLGIFDKFILYVGTIAPHKNIDTLIRAFAPIKASGYPYKLVIAGKKGWMYEEVFKIASELQLEKDIVFTGFVSDEELEVLYKQAEVFVSASLYEGFGFPPLEAMGRGCVAVVSDIPVFRETCGDSVVYCDPKKVEDITRSILEALSNKELRQALMDKGKKRVGLFNWDKVAKQTYETYLEVLDNKRGIK